MREDLFTYLLHPNLKRPYCLRREYRKSPEKENVHFMKNFQVLQYTVRMYMLLCIHISTWLPRQGGPYRQMP
jgi:hypothetical protein